jgi:hypothetical protein
MSASAIVWFEDFQLTQNAEGTHPDRFQIGHRYTSLVGLATRAGSSVLNGVNGCSQPIHDIHAWCSIGRSSGTRGGFRPFAAAARGSWPRRISGHSNQHAPRSDAAHCTKGSYAQKEDFANPCKAHLIVASSPASRSSRTFALPPLVHCIAFLQVGAPHRW